MEPDEGYVEAEVEAWDPLVELAPGQWVRGGSVICVTTIPGWRRWIVRVALHGTGDVVIPVADHEDAVLVADRIAGALG